MAVPSLPLRFEFRHVASVLERVALLGGRTDGLLEAAGLESQAARHPVVVGPPAHIEALLAEAAKRTRRPAFGLELATVIPRGRFGWLELALQSAPTLGDGWQILARYSAMLNRDSGYAYVTRPDQAIMAYETPRQVGGLGPHLNEFTIGLLLAKSRAGVPSEWRPARAWFAHKAPTSAAVVDGMFQCGVEFGQATSGLAIPSSVARASIETHDPVAHQLVRAHLDELMPTGDSSRPTTARARGQVLERIGRDKIGISEIARALGTSARTLQRELADEGSTFAELVEDARRGLSETLLAHRNLTIGEVAARLGYADTRGFDRAFTRWTGKTPSAWRAEMPARSPLQAPPRRAPAIGQRRRG